MYVCAVPPSWFTEADVPPIVAPLPSEDDQVYEVIADPPFAGADQEMLSVVVPATLAAADGVGDDTDGAPGVAGTVVTVIEPEAADAAEVPAALVAVTVIVVTAPVPKPVIVSGEDDPVAVCVVLCTLQKPDAV